MTEPPCKRPRDADDHHDFVQPLEEHDSNKRLRPYEDVILSLLKEDEDVPGHDLSSFISSLQQELSSPTAAPVPLSASSSSSSSPKGEDKENERIMRRLLEASDDELGLPSRDKDDGGFCWGEDFGNGPVTYDGLWEIDEEDADYQTLIQSELFM